MSRSDLSKEVLISLNLSGINLENATIMANDLSGTNLDRANLKGANLSKTIIRGTTTFRGAQLDGANLDGVVISVQNSRYESWVGVSIRGGQNLTPEANEFFIAMQDNGYPIFLPWDYRGEFSSSVGKK